MTTYRITTTGEMVTKDELRQRLTAELDAMDPSRQLRRHRRRPDHRQHARRLYEKADDGCTP